MKKVFRGLKVVELAGVLAGPATGLFFAELGAKVTKVENRKSGGDVTRTWKLSAEKKEARGSAYYYSVNLLKKIVFADLENAADHRKILSLISEADILIVNFKRGDDKKFGLSYLQLKRINPSLIYASISGFGDDDDRVAYDLVLQAESGYMSMNGTKESGPVKMPVAFIDLFAAHQLKEAILIALMQRNKTGKGCKVSVSLYDAAIASLANQASNFLNAGFVPQLQGSLHPNIAPYGELFTTSDGKQITFAIGSDKQFKLLCGILGKTELAADVKFSDNPSRIKNRVQLKKMLVPLVKNVPARELLKACHQHFVPAALIRNLKEVLSDKRAKKLIIEQQTPDGKYYAVRSFVSSMNVNK